MTHVVVDPITRIEGHLRIEAEVDGGVLRDAWSSSTMFRGIELILKGRDPRDAWAFTQRICGVCTTVHAIASIRAVENAIGATPPLPRGTARQPLEILRTVHSFDPCMACGVHVVDAKRRELGSARSPSTSCWTGTTCPRECAPSTAEPWVSHCCRTSRMRVRWC
jgi:Ni,Fe-hydrogenase I large subunit